MSELGVAKSNEEKFDDRSSSANLSNVVTMASVACGNDGNSTDARRKAYNPEGPPRIRLSSGPPRIKPFENHDAVIPRSAFGMLVGEEIESKSQVCPRIPLYSGLSGALTKYPEELCDEEIDARLVCPLALLHSGLSNEMSKYPEELVSPPFSMSPGSPFGLPGDVMLPELMAAMVPVAGLGKGAHALRKGARSVPPGASRCGDRGAAFPTRGPLKTALVLIGDRGHGLDALRARARSNPCS